MQICQNWKKKNTLTLKGYCFAGISGQNDSWDVTSDDAAMLENVPFKTASM